MIGQKAVLAFLAGLLLSYLCFRLRPTTPQAELRTSSILVQCRIRAEDRYPRVLDLLTSTARVKESALIGVHRRPIILVVPRVLVN
jgi:hypothetical protein